MAGFDDQKRAGQLAQALRPVLTDQDQSAFDEVLHTCLGETDVARRSWLMQQAIVELCGTDADALTAVVRRSFAGSPVRYQRLSQWVMEGLLARCIDGSTPPKVVTGQLAACGFRSVGLKEPLRQACGDAALDAQGAARLSLLMDTWAREIERPEEPYALLVMLVDRFGRGGLDGAVWQGIFDGKLLESLQDSAACQGKIQALILLIDAGEGVLTRDAAFWRRIRRGMEIGFDGRTAAMVDAFYGHLIQHPETPWGAEWDTVAVLALWRGQSTARLAALLASMSFDRQAKALREAAVTLSSETIFIEERLLCGEALRALGEPGRQLNGTQSFEEMVMLVSELAVDPLQALPWLTDTQRRAWCLALIAGAADDAGGIYHLG